MTGDLDGLVDLNNPDDLAILHSKWEKLFPKTTGEKVIAQRFEQKDEFDLLREDLRSMRTVSATHDELNLDWERLSPTERVNLELLSKTNRLEVDVIDVKWKMLGWREQLRQAIYNAKLKKSSRGSNALKVVIPLTIIALCFYGLYEWFEGSNAKEGELRAKIEASTTSPETFRRERCQKMHAIALKFEGRAQDSL